jgi:hypothetical protein
VRGAKILSESIPCAQLKTSREAAQNISDKSETQAAAHSALVARFAFFDGAALGKAEFQQIAKLSGYLI